jgi:hypothetical protein
LGVAQMKLGLHPGELTVERIGVVLAMDVEINDV